MVVWDFTSDLAVALGELVIVGVAEAVAVGMTVGLLVAAGEVLGVVVGWVELVFRVVVQAVRVEAQRNKVKTLFFIGLY